MAGTVEAVISEMKPKSSAGFPPEVVRANSVATSVTYADAAKDHIFWYALSVTTISLAI
jgi:hypothetical protein